MLELSPAHEENRQDIFLYRGIPERNETPSTFSRQVFFKFLRETLSKRLTNYFFQEDFSVFERARELLVQIREGITQEMADSMWEDFNTNLANYIYLLKDIGVPSMVIERNGIIHYANPAYRELTGFSKAVPTLLSNLEFHSQLSEYGLAGFVKAIISLFDKTIGDKTYFSFATGVRKEGLDEYIQGTMSISFKRDILGIPLIFLASFLPNMS